MSSSSGKVKLNRAALIGLRLVPRRRRIIPNIHTPERIKQDPHEVSGAFVNGASGPRKYEREDSEKNYIGRKQTKRENDSAVRVMQNKMASIQEGILTRGKFHQSKPNTRSKSRLDTLNKQRESRLICRLCYNTDLACVRMKGNCATLIGKTPLAVNKTTTTGAKARVRLKQLTGPEARELRVARAGREGQGRVKAGATPCVRRCVAEPGEALTGTGSMPTELSNNGRIVHLSKQADSEESVRNTIKVSKCAVCGVCKRVSPQQKIVRKQGNSSPVPEHPVGTQIKNKTTVTKHKKIVLWTPQNPKVTLCDIGQKCVRCSHNCSFVLPDVINTKAVNCFKKDMRAGDQFKPTCLGCNKHRREERTPAENNALWHRAQSEQKACQSRNMNNHEENVKKHTGRRILSTHPYHSVKKCTNKFSATCSSLLQDKGKKKEQCFRDKDIEEIPGPKFGILPSTADLNSICSKSQSETDLRYKKKTDDVMSFDSQSSLELDRATEDIHKKSCGQISSSGETDASHEFSASNTENDMDDITGNSDDPESFSCQRVRVYSRKTIVSCARTYMSWPFSNRGRAPVGHSDIVGCPAKDLGTLVTDSSPSPSNYGLQDSITDATFKSSRNTFDHQNRGWKHTKDHLEMARERMLGKRDVERRENMTSDSLSSKNRDCLPHCMGTAESPAGTASDSMYCTAAQRATATTHTVLCSPAHESQSSTSSIPPSPSLLGLSDGDMTATLSPCSPPFTNGHLSNCLPSTASETLTVQSEETQMTCDSASSVYPDSLGSFNLCESFLLPQDESEKTSASSSPPQLEPYYKTLTLNHCLPVWSADTDFGMFMPPPLLSPVVSPRGQSETNCSGEEEDNNNRRGYNMHQVVKVRGENSGHDLCAKQGQTSSNYDTSKGDEADHGNGNTLVNSYLEQVPSDPEIRDSRTSDVETESCPSPSSVEDEAFSKERQMCSVNERGNPHEIVGSKAEAADDPHSTILDEFSAYKQDILLVNVMQDDPELFDNMPKESLLKLGPVRVIVAPETRPTEVSKTQRGRITAPAPEIAQRMTPVNIDFHCDSPDRTEDTNRPWRPQCKSIIVQSSAWSATDKQTITTGQSVAKHCPAYPGWERTQPIQTVNNHIPLLVTNKSGIRTTNLPNVTDFRHQKTNAYCWQYFSESQSCGFKVCRFQHVPMGGDEKFCVDAVKRFVINPMCIKKAGAVFTGYYQNNLPGVYFSMPVFLSLLWGLLKAGFMSELFSVLHVSLAHKIVPEHEFLLALFKIVREKGLTGFVPELMQLIFKMANAGLVLSLDCLDCVRNIPESQHAVGTNTSLSVSWNNEDLIMVNSVMEIELCTKQEDWSRMGEVFSSICQFKHHPNQVERISGRIAIVLLSENKDRLSLPFAAFAETVCQKNEEDSISRRFLGRIGVSLMLRYHKTHHWAKGQKVVEMLTVSKISFSTLKGLFGNEDCTSRCHLITVATELYLLSGCVEGALNILEENNWFLTSHLWPCEPADLESRTRVLMCLAEKTSQRDTLRVLCKLPGLQEQNGNIDTDRHAPVFNSHLQACVNRQILPVASDTVNFMLSKNLAVDHGILQALLHKLGKQNHWLRARKIFRCCLNEGYYPGVSAPPGFRTLIVPCRLGEVELALTFEMFITVNADTILLPPGTTATLSITLNRTESCESEYLSAGSRVLSAACILQPKLIIHYTAVNSSQEQVFTLDISSARRWLLHNRIWANEMWSKFLFPPTVPGNPFLPLP